MRLVGAGSELLARAAPADELGGCCGQLGRVAARVTFLHHSLLALEPQHGPSFSLSLLIHRCMRQLRWWRAAAMLAPSGHPHPPHVQYLKLTNSIILRSFGGKLYTLYPKHTLNVYI